MQGMATEQDFPRQQPCNCFDPGSWTYIQQMHNGEHQCPHGNIAPGTMTTPQLPPPGWYPTDNRGGLRYWDGGQWGQTAPVPPPTPEARNRRNGIVLAIAFVLTVVIGGGVYLKERADTAHNIECMRGVIGGREVEGCP